MTAPLTREKIKALRERRFRHKKRGTEYVLIGIGKMQASPEDWMRRVPEIRGRREEDWEPVDMREVAIYRSATDPTEIWVRPREEFEDGRFEELPALATALSKAQEDGE